MLDRRPRFGLAAAPSGWRASTSASTAARRALTSERDQNFLIAAPDGARMVLKIANAAEERAMLEAQQRAITHLRARLDTTPRVAVARSTDRALVETTAPDGEATFRLGDHLARRHAARRPSCAGRASCDADFGRQVGALRRELADFDHPAIPSRLLLGSGERARDRRRERSLAHRRSRARRAIDRLIGEFDRRTAPLLADAAARDHPRRSQRPQRARRRRRRRRSRAVSASSGIVDFGDMVHSYRVGELAIAIAYAMLDRDDPLDVAAAIVRGYCERSTLDDDELAALFGLVLLRLCASACIAADSSAQRPDNAYLGVSQAAIRATLPAARRRFRSAWPRRCFATRPAFAPSPASERVSRLSRAAPTVAPVLGVDLATRADASCSI